MIEIQVELKGTSPLLMDNPKTMFDPKPSKKKGEEYKKEEDAEKRTYRKEGGELYVPFEWILGCMRNASKYVKTKRGTPPLRQVISGILRIEPEQIGLETSEYEIDVRRGVIQKISAIPVARPMIKEWKIGFKMLYNPDLVPVSPSIFKELLELGGSVVGIGAYRPEHTGPFGRFEISKWEVKE